MGCNVDKGDMLPGLPSASCGGGEACFDGVVLSGQHCIGHRVLYRDYDIGELCGAVLLGVREDVSTIRCGSEVIGGMGMCCLDFSE